jgi:serine/threonine protein kinase
MATDVPKKLGKYEIIRELGRGSMGVVYEGHDPFTDHRVALKVANTHTFKNEKTAERYKKTFFNEAHTAGMLKHPNIIEILDAGADDDVCYIVMELVEGGHTLKPYCKPDNLLPYEQVVEIIFKCAKALDYAHRVGVIHRDIKPTNILLTKDMDVKFCDFSIAHLMTEEAESTMPTGFVGSPRYMSPEQVQEDMITNQTDLFSLGIVMYEPPKLKSYRKDIPEVFEKIIHHVLQKNPEKRYKMGLNMAADLSLAFDFIDAPLEDLDEKEWFSQVKQLEFFQGFSEAEIWEIIRSCVWQEFDAGQEVVVQGDVDEAFYIIVDGDVDVYRENKRIGSIKAGECFGEMGYLANTERTASIKAKDAVRLLKINSTVIDQLSVGCQLHFNKVFLRTLVKRLSQTTAKVLNGD